MHVLTTLIKEGRSAAALPWSVQLPRGGSSFPDWQSVREPHGIRDPISDRRSPSPEVAIAPGGGRAILLPTPDQASRAAQNDEGRQAPFRNASLPPTMSDAATFPARRSHGGLTPRRS